MSAASGTPGRPTSGWGFQGNLFQFRQPALWLFAILLVVAGYRTLSIQLALAQVPTAFITSWALVLVYALPVALVVYRLDLFEREPLVLLAAALIWGGVVAAGLAVTANDAWSSVLGKAAPALAVDWTPAVVAPPVEETLKLMGVAVLWLIVPEEFDGALDGFVYGAMIGLGFTMVEDVLYFVSPVLSSGVDQTSPVFDSFLIRVIGGGLYGHVTFAGLSGLGFAWFVTSQASFERRVAGFLGCFGAALAAHAFWDSPLLGDVLSNGGAAPTFGQILLWCTLKGLPFFLLLVVLVIVATRTEERNFRRLVAGEPDPDLFPDGEVRSLGSLWARRSARIAAGRRHGPIGARLTVELQSAQVEYARVRAGSASPDEAQLDEQRRRIRMIRAAMLALPDRAAPYGRGRSWRVAAEVAAPAYPPGDAVHGAGGSPGTGLPAASAGVSPAGSPAGSSGDTFPATSPLVAGPSTHDVPAGGVAAWQAPDPARPPVAWLAPGLPLEVEARLGDWALVRAANGWRGWVDGRLLVDRSRPQDRDSAG